jgi:DUF2075 family protein
MGGEPAGSQIEAWNEERQVVSDALMEIGRHQSAAAGWGLVFEYELPLEGGRRPDLIVLAGDAVIVIEFKSARHLPVAHFDQVAAYARDIGDYHAASQHSSIHAILAPTSDAARGTERAGVRLARPNELPDALLEVADSGTQPDLHEWLASPYAPLRTLVAAARRIFEHKPLPHVRRALSARIPQTVDLVHTLVDDARDDQLRRLVLVAGVPGAGKTLVGLRVVYEHAEQHAPASFLSGNGPLVEVLQDALESRVFVRDLHAYIRRYGINGALPEHNVVVFDEAQRAWDATYMGLKRGLARSEPELLIAAGRRMRDWSTMIGLVGDGQEIYTGEEGGLGQWADAIRADGDGWEIHCAPRLAQVFDDLNVTVHNELDLTISLRSRRAERLHDWVSFLLAGDLDAAASLAGEIHSDGFPLWMTRDVEAARSYATERYVDEPDRLYGFVASSQAKNLAAIGLDNTFQATKRVKVARWFNDPGVTEHSGRALSQPITEFQCQGLELDLPVVLWGDDCRWHDDAWELRPVRRRIPLRDPDLLLLNSYRVLLTRGRDGLVIVVPDQRPLDQTAEALLRAGLQALPD